MAADDVSTWRGDIRRITREALSCADATEKVSKRSRIVKLWAAIVSETNDAADKEKLALARSSCTTPTSRCGGWRASPAASYVGEIFCSVRGYRASAAPRAAAAATRASDAVRCIKEPADFVA
eukprot:CAMPEP_0118919016 /NCGR_PEP_ID=MMETSP1166-20130328/18304_1 /TAXON_ID=1104430 /ORGANISM="Chrysoreinhardia sp, Strain CCMP3193" /LENGTH=122 /DNA_ID=CAMNT_0006859481 /DNA_START=21 /DNA_END=389 /DNA_ORIENTATION=+